MSDNTTKTIHNLIILDESGSMESIKKETISGFNELVQTIRGSQEMYPDQLHYVTLVTFNGLGMRTPILRETAASLKPLDQQLYKPDSMTPLFDAIGLSCTELEKAINGQPEVWALVTIITDGMENASKEYSGTAIREMITRLSEGNWTFTYIGANHDVTALADEMNIKNSMSYDATMTGVPMMWAKERMARNEFSKKVAYSENKESWKMSYFDIDPKPADEDKKEKK